MQQRTTIAAQYDAHVLKLRLPEQDSLRNEAERCSADPVMLASIGREVGHQFRIRRRDDARFVAVYTVHQANPDDPSRADVVRTGQAGRERLGAGAELEATVEARVLDSPPAPGEPPGIRFFEVAEHTGNNRYFIAIAPHGGMIEKHTDEQAAETAARLRTAGFPASLWSCKGFGDAIKGASERWHITSTDLHQACFPLLRSLLTRRFLYGVAFHGFAQQEGEADVYIGGAAPRSLKTALQRAVNRLGLPLQVKVSTSTDDPKFQGFSPENVINRLAARGIHLEQSAAARVFQREIADAVASVFASPWSWMAYVVTSFLRRSPDATA